MSNFLIYRASAGSGKTYNLALQYIKELLINNSQHAYRHILAVTFTKDATGEMKERIIAELYGLSRQLPSSKGFMEALQKELPASFTAEKIATHATSALTAILHDYSRFHITTIDSFFQQVLRNLARELGKGSRFNIELNTGKAIEEAVTALIERSNTDEELLGWISDYLEERLDEGGSWRIDHDLKIFGQHIFNESFQVRENAFREQRESHPNLIRDAIRACQNIRRTFESKMELFGIRYFEMLTSCGLCGDEFYGSRNGSSYITNYFHKLKNGDLNDANLRNDTVKKCLLDADSWVAKKQSNRAELVNIVASKLRPLLIEAETYRTDNLAAYASAMLLLKNIHQLALLDYISAEVDSQSRENNRFMLSHTALLLNQMIDQKLDATFIYEKIGADIKHVMIDEFQDTSHMQWYNFRALLSEMIAADRFSLLVGDVKQSIYRWRNGDWRILNNIKKELPLAQYHTLDTNYRSAKNVVTFNNTIFSSIAKQLGNNFANTYDTNVSNPFTEAYADVVQKVSKTEELGYVSVDFCKGDKAAGTSDQEAVLELLLDHLIMLYEAGVYASDICILCRTNKEIRQIADALLSQKQQHPEMANLHYFDIISADAFQLHASPALQIITAALRTIIAPENPVPRAEVYVLWQRTFALSDDEPFPILKQEVIEEQLPLGFRMADFPRLAVMPLYELILELHRLFSLERLQGQSAYVHAFLDHLTTYLQQHPSQIAPFLEFWDEELSNKSVPNDISLQGVRAMSIHKSKGLQFHTVIVPYCTWEMAKKSGFMRENLVWCNPKSAPFDLAILPIAYTKTMQNSYFVDEFNQETTLLEMDNLNVLYVAFTRAKQNLLVIAKNPPERKESLRIETLLMSALSETMDEQTQYRFGSIVPSQQQRSEQTDNLLKKRLRQEVNINFRSNQQPTQGTFFLSSNQARFFLSGDNDKSDYILQGNILHELFAHIDTSTDIAAAVATLVRQGILDSTEAIYYKQLVEEAIVQSNVSNWFTDNYTLFKECQIVSRTSNDELLTRRPDRVMIAPNSTIVVDYKFGKPHDDHAKQVQAYMHLLRQMNYQNVQGYLWYVTQKRVEEVLS